MDQRDARIQDPVRTHPIVRTVAGMPVRTATTARISQLVTAEHLIAATQKAWGSQTPSASP